MHTLDTIIIIGILLVVITIHYLLSKSLRKIYNKPETRALLAKALFEEDPTLKVTEEEVDELIDFLVKDACQKFLIGALVVIIVVPLIFF